ncbi:MAG: cadmium-translocating P-type ATPase [Ruminococcus sp.]|nr:cadmium-translocating P-type ATPase [Ruminococcus sp.]MCM1380464.1 cadmium-translocating P-type ATPase [Muribaculaceae bacterium]MCM1479061.1 cadmium-translocating P-type ATPase [Muribaculaceae bacterium]
MEMTLYLKNLDCPHCAEKIRTAAEKIPFVKTAEMNFMVKRLSLTVAEQSDEAVLKEVTKIVADMEPDVEVQLMANASAAAAPHEEEEDEGDLKIDLIKIIVAAVIFAAGFIFPERQLWIFLAAYLIAGLNVIVTAVKNIVKLRPFDECFLMTVASLGAFFVGEYSEGAAVMILYQIGELFQSYAVRRSRKSIADLMDIRPDAANLKTESGVEIVPPETVKRGDIIVVKAGEKIPLDGIIVDGSTTLDTSALTGESVPREVSKGGEVMSGCVNLTGVVEVEVTKEFGESTVSKILEMVENASAKKARSEQFITRFARVYTPCVVIAAVLLAVIPSLIGGYKSQYLYSALSFLVVSCPCALVISVPLSFFGGIGGASSRGILIKGGVTMEQLAECGTVIFDKTGTLTDGSFEITRIVPNNRSEESLLELAAIAEQGSNHPAALAVMRRFKGVPQKAEITEIAGRGVKAKSGGQEILAGNAKLMEENGIEVPLKIQSAGTIIFVAENGRYAGAVEIADSIKKDAAEAIAKLKNAGIRTVMLTGDRHEAADIIGGKLGLDEWRAELLPGGKVEAMEKIMEKSSGKTVFVGDGINDAPVLMRADAGVAMGGIGSDAAIEAADVVLMTDEPSKLMEAIRFSKKTKRIVIQNIVFSLAVKAAVLILAAFGIATMWAAVFADVGVCFLAILNAMRARKA